MAQERLTVALVSEVFWEPDGAVRLRERLEEATERGAGLVLLPELPLNPWSPASKQPRDEDAEAEGGPRSTSMAQAARGARVALVGGIIHRDPQTGRRTSRALVFDASGEIVGRYDKLYLPEEAGFWETSHYEPGDQPPAVIDALGLPIGLQLCSDVNRPQGSQLLTAHGAAAILAPRATEEATYQRWKLVLRANALTSTVYVLSVNRPHPEDGVQIGGPSVAIDPEGNVIVETTDAVALVTIEASTVERARRAYPGYLPMRAHLYAEAWSQLTRSESARR